MRALSRHTYFFALAVVLFSQGNLYGQTATIEMRDGKKISANLKGVSDEYLISWAGNYKLKKISRVLFAEKDRRRAKPFLEKLSEGGVIVIVGTKQINPVKIVVPTVSLPPVPVVATLSPLPSKFKYPRFNIGFGAGIDYGGFGGRLTAYPVDRVGVFLGVGYPIANVGIDGGVSWRLIKEPVGIVPTTIGMYGYNASIVVSKASQYDKLYYGASFGVGLEFHLKKDWSKYINVEMLFPFRNEQAARDYDYIKANVSKDVGGFAPVLFSIGYHF